jgi:hypothetical protein
MDFAYSELMSGGELISGDCANSVGSVHKLHFNDGSEWMVQVVELSDFDRTLVLDLLERNDGVEVTSCTHEIVLHRISQGEQTMVEYTVDFSNDADAQICQDTRFKRQTELKAMQAYFEVAPVQAEAPKLEDGICQLSPYFKVRDLAKFKQIWQADYAAFAHKEDCAHYAFTFSTDHLEEGFEARAHCREAYWDADTLHQHIDDVAAGPFAAVLAGPAEVERLEAHGPAAEIDKIKTGKYAGLPWADNFYTCEWGFRPTKEAMENDTVCHLYPYFQVHDVAAFKKTWSNAYAATQANAEDEKSHQYAFSFCTKDGSTTAACRESYADADSVLKHIGNVDAPFNATNGACGKEISEIIRIEMHGPAAEIAKLKEALKDAPFDLHFFETGWGFRNATPRSE